MRLAKTEAAIDVAKRAIETAEGALAKTDGLENNGSSGSSLGGQKRAELRRSRTSRTASIAIRSTRSVTFAPPGNTLTGPATLSDTPPINSAGSKPPSSLPGKRRSTSRGRPRPRLTKRHLRAALTKALWDVGHVAQIILELDWLQDALGIEAAMEGDDSPQPARLRVDHHGAMRLSECTGGPRNGRDPGRRANGRRVSPTRAAELLAMAASAPGAARIAALLKTGNPQMQKLAAGLLAKASPKPPSTRRVTKRSWTWPSTLATNA